MAISIDGWITASGHGSRYGIGGGRQETTRPATRGRRSSIASTRLQYFLTILKINLNLSFYKIPNNLSICCHRLDPCTRNDETSASIVGSGPENPEYGVHSTVAHCILSSRDEANTGPV